MIWIIDVNVLTVRNFREKKQLQGGLCKRKLILASINPIVSHWTSYWLVNHLIDFHYICYFLVTIFFSIFALVEFLINSLRKRIEMLIPQWVSLKHIHIKLVYLHWNILTLCSPGISLDKLKYFDCLDLVLKSTSFTFSNRIEHIFTIDVKIYNTHNYGIDLVLN